MLLEKHSLDEDSEGTNDPGVSCLDLLGLYLLFKVSGSLAASEEDYNYTETCGNHKNLP